MTDVMHFVQHNTVEVIARQMQRDVEEIAKLKQQCDELLEIVKEMRNVKSEILSVSPEGRKYLAKMNAAIEKASHP